MSAPHFDNGRILLKDINSENWYYVSVSILNDAPFINPGQTVVSVPVDNSFSTYLVLKAPNGNYYKVTIYSLGGIIYTSNNLLTIPEPPNRVFLRSSVTGIIYELVERPDQVGDNFLALILPGTNPASNLCTPWKLITPMTANCEREILVTDS